MRTPNAYITKSSKAFEASSVASTKAQVSEGQKRFFGQKGSLSPAQKQQVLTKTKNGHLKNGHSVHKSEAAGSGPIPKNQIY